MISVAEVHRLLLKHFSDNWDFSPIIWEMQNVHEDIDKLLSGSETRLVVSPFLEVSSVIPMEIPVSLAMKKVEFIFNILLAEPEGFGNKNTLEAIDSLNALYSSKMLRLSKDGSTNHVTLDFGEVELGTSELVQGKYLSMALISCVSFF